VGNVRAGKAAAEVGSIDDRPDVGRDPYIAQALRSIHGGHPQTDMANVPGGREVLISKNEFEM
jgi:hypothetical protein